MVKSMCLINNYIIKDEELLSYIDFFVEKIFNIYLVYPERILIVLIYICIVVVSAMVLLMKKGPIF